MTPADRLLSAASSLCDLDVAATCAALCPTGIRGATGVLTGAQAVASFAMLSTCMMAAAAIIRAAWFYPQPPEPYEAGSAPRLLVQLVNASPYAPDRAIAGVFGALYRPTLDRPPVVGGLVWYAAAPGHSEHVDACVADCGTVPLLGVGALPSLGPAGSIPAQAFVYSAYAGGRPPAEGMPGSWAVRTVARTLVWVPKQGAWVDSATLRPVLACGDPETLAQMYGGGT